MAAEPGGSSGHGRIDSPAALRRASVWKGRAVSVKIETEKPVRPDVAALLRASRAMMAGLYPPESRHGLDLGAYERPEVTLFVAREDGVAVGCGAFELHGDGSAEVKSMFVAKSARGRGVGRAILDAIEAAVRGRVGALRLETGVKQLPAIRLYEAAGFQRRGPFGSYTDDPLSLFMDKSL
jgi:putative acetyltransferase